MKLRVFLLLGLFSSCIDSSKILPKSSGSVSEVLFVVDDSLWDKYIGNIVYDIFGKEILGVSRPEPSFNILQINNSEFSSLFKTHQNIVLISEDSSFNIVNDNWAKNQMVAQLGYNGHVERFKSDCVKLYNLFYDKELVTLRKSILQRYNYDYTQIIKREFNIDVVISSEYSLVLDSTGIVWFTYNPQNKEEIKNILVFSINDSQEGLNDSILSKSNKILSTYLKGSKDNSYVKLESRYTPVMYRGSYRGMWKLQNGFMGGPIIIKPYFMNDKVVIVASLIFAPQSSKRKYIKEIESIL